jgi:hypothetical protein
VSFDLAVLKKKFTHVQQHTFIKEHFLGIGKNSALRVWLVSLFFPPPILSCFLQHLSLFWIVVAVAVQSAFRLEMYQNNVFFIF